MTGNPSQLPQIPHSQRLSRLSFADSPSKFNPFGSSQVSPAQKTLLDHEMPQNEISPRHYLGHRPSKSFVPFVLDVKSTKVSPQQKLDTKTLESLDKLFDIKNARVRASIMNSRRSINIGSVEIEDPAEDSNSEDEETVPAPKVIPPEKNNGQAMISKVKVFIGHKGLEAMTRSRQFDENLAIFNQVKTFVDIRKVIKETADANSSPLPKSTIIITEPTTASTNSISKETARMTIESNNNTPNPLRGDSSFKVSRDSSNVNTPNKSKKRVPKLEKRGSIFGSVNLEVLYPQLGRGRRPVDIHLSLPPPKPIVPKEMTAEELREQEIRKLYMQLKENAIKKFGPEIFDNIQHKLNNPKHIKQVTKKRREELKALRNTKKELGNFDLGGNLVNYLSTQDKQANDDDEDSPRKFNDNFDSLKTNPEDEEESGVYEQVNEQTPYPIATWTQEVNKNTAGTNVLRGLMNPLWIPKNGNNMVSAQEDDEERPEDDPQIKMFQQIEEYKKKSNQIIKAMTNKAAKAFKEEVVPGNNPSMTRIPEKRNTHNFSTSMTTMDFSSQFGPVFSKKNVQPSLITALPFDVEKKLFNKNQTLMRSVISEKGEYPSPKHGQLHSISPSRDDNKRVRKLKEITQALSVGFLTPVVLSPKVHSTINSYRDKFDDLCLKMDRVENDNKMINSNLKASFKQMEDPFRRQSRALNNFETPESLLTNQPKSYKSTSKLAISLASKSIKDAKLK